MLIRIEHLDPDRHDRAAFSCGEASLDAYLKRRDQTQASQDAKREFSTTFCLVDPEEPEQIIGYFTLAPAGLGLSTLPESLRRRLPSYRQIPAFRLARLAVATPQQGKEIGARLLVEALRGCIENPLNAWAVVVDALPHAAGFYVHFGFQPFTDDSERLFMTMADVRKTIQR